MVAALAGRPRHSRCHGRHPRATLDAMTTRTWLAGAVIAGGAVLAMRGCLSKPAADERLAERFEKLCDIARANIETPERGVRRLGHYLGEHGGDILKDFGDTIATIEKVRDDRKHDD